ncbi:polysaccharide biosynthesis tyrosine autokinase [Microbacterium sp. 1.5R]|uniref:polysaccharide biosynthesis tyrosine autokinase n=1 Tax=Microbacterium sp. 1.5R TaxID=1916917 RepID=UPI0011A92CC3|nr:polysaccharide biosynthesis tyrosine autokinase [Microbacterium sp. 1.5R]
MDLKDYLTALRDRWYLLVAATVIGAVAGVAYATVQPDQYEATTSAYVSSQRGDTVSELVQGSQYTQGLMQSYANLATTPAVLQPVIDDLRLDTTVDDLAKKISAEVELNTVIVTLTVVSEDPADAQTTAKAVMDSLTEVVSGLSPKDADQNPSIELTTVTPPSQPDSPFAPNTRLIAVTGAMLGLVLAVVYAILKQLLDTRIRTEEDAERSARIPFLGRVPRPGGARKTLRTSISAQWDASGSTREAYRRLAASLDFADIDGDLRMVVVSSAFAGEGKTTTAVNLTLALAERRPRVLLIDADLRRPRVAEACGLDGSVGLTTALTHQASLADSIQTWGTRNIDVLTSGLRPPNPTEVVSSAAMQDLLREVRDHYDFVVVDSAPVLPVSDTLTLARASGASLLVGRYKVTRRQSLRRAVDTLTGAGARVIGFVLNAVPPEHSSSSYYEDAEVIEPAAPSDSSTSPSTSSSSSSSTSSGSGTSAGSGTSSGTSSGSGSSTGSSTEETQTGAVQPEVEAEKPTQRHGQTPKKSSKKPPRKPRRPDAP